MPGLVLYLFIAKIFYEVEFYYFFFQAESHYVAQAEIFLPLPPMGCDYRCTAIPG